MGKAKTTGDILEQAVRTIETAILQSSPGTAHAKLTIETKKLVIIDGVKHEIDIYVHVDPGGGYDSIVIFECKNWRKTVGKNEVIVLSEKVKAVSAQRGFIVGPRFSRYAVAQAKRDPRVQLLRFSTDVPTWSALLNMHGVIRDNRHTRVHVQLRPSEAAVIPDAAIEISGPAFLDGVAVPNLEEYLRPIVESMVKAHLAAEPTHEYASGEYSYEVQQSFDFAHATINDLPIDGFDLTVSFTIHVVRPSIVSVFAVEKRGRVYTTEIFKAGEHYVSMQYILKTTGSDSAG